MATINRPRLAWFVELTEEYGQARLLANIVHQTADGDPRAIVQWSSMYQAAARFYGLEVSAYVGGSRFLSASGIWAPGVRYKPFDIATAEQARAIATVLGRIERGLDRLNAADGYLDDRDYAGYLIRVSRVLSVTRFLVRASCRHREQTGEPWYTVDGSGLQRWVERVAEDVMNGNRREHLPGG